jgi:large subunit ribosomal protein L27e
MENLHQLMSVSSLKLVVAQAAAVYPSPVPPPLATMVKFLKPGRIVVVLQGRMAGKKAVIVKNFDDGTKQRQFGHALVAGVMKPPMKVTRKMTQKKVEKRSSIKPFIKYVNYTHIMPTRYQVPAEFNVKTLVTDDQMEKPGETRREAKANLRKVLKDTYMNPIMSKDGKPSKDMAFLTKRLRF